MAPSAYTTSGLSGRACTFDRGGYCQFGKIVIVNIRLCVTETIIGVAVIGFPAPMGGTIGTVGYGGDNETLVAGYLTNIDEIGRLVIPSHWTNGDQLLNKHVLYSFAYLAK